MIKEIFLTQENACGNSGIIPWVLTRYFSEIIVLDFQYITVFRGGSRGVRMVQMHHQIVASKKISLFFC